MVKSGCTKMLLSKVEVPRASAEARPEIKYLSVSCKLLINMIGGQFVFPLNSVFNSVYNFTN